MDLKKNKRVRASESPTLTKADASGNKEEVVDASGNKEEVATGVEKGSESLPVEKNDNDNSVYDGEIVEDLIHTDNVSDRRLFYDATDGNVEKYKFSVALDDHTSTNQIWVGVTAKTCPIKHYITMKDENGKLATIFLDHINRNILKTAFASFLQTGNPNQLWRRDGVLSPHPLQFSTADDCLIITHVLNPLEPVVFTKEAINQFYDKEWVLERFVKYLHNKNELMRYGENILSVCTSKCISRQEFGRMWMKPPNRTLSLDDVWNLLKKKYLGY